MFLGFWQTNPSFDKQFLSLILQPLESHFSSKISSVHQPSPEGWKDPHGNDWAESSCFRTVIQRPSLTTWAPTKKKFIKYVRSSPT